MNRESFDEADFQGRMAQTSHWPAAPVFDIGRADHKMINRLLKQLLSRLHRHYNIDKASLTFYDHERDSLRVTHILSKGALKSGLTLTIPNRLSLLYEVLMQGYPIVDNYPDLVSANIIEKKILLTPATRSVAVIPLISEGMRLGLLSLASDRDSAFSPYLEGEGEDLVEEFIAQTKTIVSPTDIPE